MFDKPVFSNRNEPITRKDNRIFSGASATPAAQPVADLTTRAALQAAAAEAPTEAPALATPAPIPAEAASSGEANVSEARLIVGPELREKFDRQRYLLNQAIWHGELEDVRRESMRMVKAWLALNAAAEAAGKLPISPHVWEVALGDGSVAAIVPDNDHAHAVVAEGRQVAVYTLDEIARFLSVYPAIAKAKLTFPGATVTAVRRSVDDPLLAIHDTQADLNDPVPDLA